MKPLYLRSRITDPYYNLAVEECLLDRAGSTGPMLFLWQSANAVVIGKNQNPWKETDFGFLARQRITLARRMSGGGAVYHDRGNLNFSFIADTRAFDPDRQLHAVMEAVRGLGVDAAADGRKALYARGRKFSGSAFAFRRGRALHHGTVLVNTSLDMMRALRGGVAVTDGRGVPSLPSEVINLASLNGDITVGAVADAIVRRSGEMYAAELSVAGIGDVCDGGALAALVEKHRSWEWRYGCTPPFVAEVGSGSGRLLIRVERGSVVAVTDPSRGDEGYVRRGEAHRR